MKFTNYAAVVTVITSLQKTMDYYIMLNLAQLFFQALLSVFWGLFKDAIDPNLLPGMSLNIIFCIVAVFSYTIAHIVWIKHIRKGIKKAAGGANIQRYKPKVGRGWWSSTFVNGLSCLDYARTDTDLNLATVDRN